MAACVPRCAWCRHLGCFPIPDRLNNKTFLSPPCADWCGGGLFVSSLPERSGLTNQAMLTLQAARTARALHLPLLLPELVSRGVDGSWRPPRPPRLRMDRFYDLRHLESFVCALPSMPSALVNAGRITMGRHGPNVYRYPLAETDATLVDYYQPLLRASPEPKVLMARQPFGINCIRRGDRQANEDTVALWGGLVVASELRRSAEARVQAMRQRGCRTLFALHARVESDWQSAERRVVLTPASMAAHVAAALKQPRVAPVCLYIACGVGRGDAVLEPYLKVLVAAPA